MKKTGPEFLDHHRISVLPENCNSRISGINTFFRYDPKHRVRKFWNKHNISVGFKNTVSRVSGTFTAFWLDEKNWSRISGPPQNF
jgi:hypothetical protein